MNVCDRGLFGHRNYQSLEISEQKSQMSQENGDGKKGEVSTLSFLYESHLSLNN